MSRILSMNEHYIKHMDEKELFQLLKVYCKNFKKSIDDKKNDTLIKSMKFLKNKAKTLQDIYQNAQYIINNNVEILPEDLRLLDDPSKKILKDFLNEYEKISIIDKGALEKVLNGLIDKHKINFKGAGQPLRIVLTGSKFGPGIYDIILSLDKNVVIKRLKMVK